MRMQKKKAFSHLNGAAKPVFPKIHNLVKFMRLKSFHHIDDDGLYTPFNSQQCPMSNLFWQFFTS